MIFDFVKGKLRMKKGPADVSSALMACLEAAYKRAPLEQASRERLKMVVSLSVVQPKQFGKYLVQALSESIRPSIFVQEARSTGLLRQVAPDLVSCVGFAHGCGPSEDVYDHLMATLDCVPSGRVGVRLAALLHDLAKPWAWSLHGGKMVFEAVEDRSRDMAREWMTGLGISKEVINEACQVIELQDPKVVSSGRVSDWGSLDERAKEGQFSFWVGHVVSLARPKGAMGDLGLVMSNLRHLSSK